MSRLFADVMFFEPEQDDLIMEKKFMSAVRTFSIQHRQWREDELATVLRMLVHMVHLRWAASQKIESRLT